MTPDAPPSLGTLMIEPPLPPAPASLVEPDVPVPVPGPFVVVHPLYTLPNATAAIKSSDRPESLETPMATAFMNRERSRSTAKFQGQRPLPVGGARLRADFEPQAR